MSVAPRPRAPPHSFLSVPEKRSSAAVIVCSLRASAADRLRRSTRTGCLQSRGTGRAPWSVVPTILESASGTRAAPRSPSCTGTQQVRPTSWRSSETRPSPLQAAGERCGIPPPPCNPVPHSQSVCASPFYPPGITDVDVAPPTSSDSPATVVSVSKDGSARVFRVSLPAASRGAAAASAGAPLSVHADAVLSGHTEGVESVAVTADGARCATGGWDSALLLWDLRDVQAEAASQPPEAGAAGGGKRRKGAAGAAAPRAAAISEPAMRLAGHTGCVSAVCWQGTENLFSASWDHTLRRWDPDTGVNTQTLNAGGSKARRRLLVTRAVLSRLLCASRRNFRLQRNAVCC